MHQDEVRCGFEYFYNLLAKCWLNVDIYKTKPLIYNDLNTLKVFPPIPHWVESV
jgi:hypothetical protein